MKLALILGSLASFALSSSSVLAAPSGACPELGGYFVRNYVDNEPKQGFDTIIIAQSTQGGLQQYWIRYFWSVSPHSAVSDETVVADGVLHTGNSSMFGQTGSLVDCVDGGLLVLQQMVGAGPIMGRRYGLDSQGNLTRQDGAMENGKFVAKPDGSDSRPFIKQK